jgi:hypothetical protein
MNFAKSLFSRALLATALVTGAGAAVAGPVYHVDLDTVSFQDLGTGFLDMTFLPGLESGPATATLSHLSGNYGDFLDMSAPGVSGSVAGQVVFDNAQFADLFRSIKLGGHFGFDLSFSGPDSGIGGTDFDVSLYDDTGMNLLVASLVRFTLQPGSVAVSFQEDYATVGPAADVPEPSAALLVLIGLLMAGAVARRRRA